MRRVLPRKGFLSGAPLPERLEVQCGSVSTSSITRLGFGVCDCEALRYWPLVYAFYILGVTRPLRQACNVRQ